MNFDNNDKVTGIEDDYISNLDAQIPTDPVENVGTNQGSETRFAPSNAEDEYDDSAIADEDEYIDVQNDAAADGVDENEYNNDYYDEDLSQNGDELYDIEPNIDEDLSNEPMPEESMSDVTNGYQEPEQQLEKPQVAAVASNKKKPAKSEAKPEKQKKQKGSERQDDSVLSRPLGIRLAKDEAVVKSYNLVNTGKMGLAIVTNRRLIFRTNHLIDVNIQDVEAVRSCKYTQFKGAKFFFGLLFIIALAVVILLKLPARFDDKLWLAYSIIGLAGLLALIGFIMICGSFKRKFAISIFTKDLTELVTFHSAMGKRDAQLLVQVIEATPGKEFKDFVNEIGSWILDIKEGHYN